MKKQDFIFILGVAVLLLPFFICRPVYEWYHAFNAAHGMIMSFLKFAILFLISGRSAAVLYCQLRILLHLIRLIDQMGQRRRKHRDHHIDKNEQNHKN